MEFHYKQTHYMEEINLAEQLKLHEYNPYISFLQTNHNLQI